MMTNVELADLVDLDRYPIGDLTSPVRNAAVRRAQLDLRRDGCAVITGLIRPEAVGLLDQEIRARKQSTHYSTEVINPYFHVAANPDYPDDHAVNTFRERARIHSRRCMG